MPPANSDLADLRRNLSRQFDMSMDAFVFRAALLACVALSIPTAEAATARTRNFVVTAATQEIADKASKAAEFWRKDLAIQWLNQELPNWPEPCPIQVNVGRIGASGATTFSFDNGHVFGWRMEVNGSLERILDSVIPHEVNHTILASYFRRPLPRWADEGAATLVEADSERAVQTRTLNQVLQNNRRIPLQQLLDIREYPADKMQVYALYAEGYALADFLVQQHPEQGRFVYLHFLQTAHEHGWDAAIKKHYQFTGVSDLDKSWSNWILAGSPRLLPEGEMLASNDAATSVTEPELVARGQSPAEPEPLAMIPRPLRQNNTPDRKLIQPTGFLAPDLPLEAPQPIPPAAESEGLGPNSDAPEWTRFPTARTR